MTPFDAGSRWKKSLELLLFWSAVTLLAMMLAPLQWRCPQGQGHLDSSWVTVLWHAHEQGLAFGKDIVFTYGPLGYVTVGTAPDGPWASTFWLVAGLTFLAIAPVAMLLRRRPWPIAAGLAVLLLALPWFATGLDTLVPAGLFAWGLLAITAEDDPRWSWVGLVALVGLGGLMKFTWLVAGLATLLAVAGDLALRRRFRTAAVLLLGGLAVFLAGWLVAGQSFADLPGFFARSWQIAVGYSRAMGMPGPRDVLWLEIISIGLVLWTAAVAARQATLPAGDRLAARRGLLFAWLLALTFLAWKHGVVRAAEGDIHGTMLAAWAVVAAFSLAAIPPPQATGARFGLVRACGVALLAIAVVYRLGFGPLETNLVTSPNRLIDHARMLAGVDPRQAEAVAACPAKATELALPATRAMVGGASLDIFGHLQDYAIANEFAYAPRPVFQSYSAYNRGLQELNERFYLGEKGPQFALLALQSIDGRFPPLEDAACLRAILWNYSLVGREGPFLVLERQSAKPATLEVIAEGMARVGERVAVEGRDSDDLWLEIDLSLSLRGRLESLLLRPPPCGIRVWSDAAGDEGRAFNAPAAMLAAGFIASPLLEGPADVAAALTSGSTRRLRAFAVDAKRVPGGGSFSWRLSAIRGGLAGHPAAADAVAEYPGFTVRPTECRSRTPTMIVEEAGTRMLKVDPPSEIVIDVPAEATSVEGGFAMLAAAYQEGATDGSEFIIECGPRAEEIRELSRRLLAPATRPEDRGIQRFSLPLPPGDDRQLILRTTNGPADNAFWDWACWSDVRFGSGDPTPPAGPAAD